VKYLRYVPNADHSLKGSDAAQSIFVYYQAILDGGSLPKFTWKLEGNDGIRVGTRDHPIQVLLWRASNPAARDFRLETAGRAPWSSSPLAETGSGVYWGRSEIPSKGWTAFFVELTFPGRGGVPFKFTTQVRVVPDTLPFPPPVSRGH
jgi:PhoPQ-activated pathogenicity-related protein